jgi:molecular chaperone DnaJ
MICNDCSGNGGTNIKTCNKCNGLGHCEQNIQMGFMVIQQRGPCNKCNQTGKIISNVCLKCNGNKVIS